MFNIRIILFEPAALLLVK